MRTKTISIAVLSLALLAAGNAQTKTSSAKKSAKPAAPAAQPAPSPMEPRALDILKATSARLAGAQTLSFSAVELFEQPSRLGDPLAYTTKYDVKMHRPDRLRVAIGPDGPVSEFYYDGTSMMAFAPAENLLAVADAPPTVDAMLESVYHTAGIYFPFSDVLVSDPYKDMQPALQGAYYVGQSRVVGGTTTDIVAYVDGGVFIQMWVGADDKLPRMIRAVYLDDPAGMRHELVFSDWQLESTLPPDTFAPAAASTAKRIKFAHPAPEAPPANPAPAKTN